MSNTVKDSLKLVERELIRFASYENVRSVLSKYSIGQYDKDLVEKLLVILTTEFRHKIEKMSSNLPEDDVEASFVVSRRAASKPASRKTSSGDEIIQIDEEENMV
jgi:diphthamide synthase subunit DPH2